MVTVRDLLPHFKNKKTKIAACFDIEKQAVSAWGMDKPIPNARYLELRYDKRPDLFTEDGKLVEPKCP